MSWKFRVECFVNASIDWLINLICEKEPEPEVRPAHLQPIEFTSMVLDFLRDNGIDARLRRQFRLDWDGEPPMPPAPPVCIGIYSNNVYKSTLITENGLSLHKNVTRAGEDNLYYTYDLNDPQCFDKLLADVIRWM